jgi:hypothetical protein
MASWNKLADRCRLFTDRPRALLIELLKEAEEELGRKCDILEQSKEIVAPLKNDSATSNQQPLPDDFKKMISVYHKGVLLSPMSADERVLNTTNDIYSGTPTRYYISNNNIVLNKAPKSSDQILLTYFSNISNITSGKTFPFSEINTSGTHFHIYTDLTTELNNLSGTINGTSISAITYSTINATSRATKFTYTGSVTADNHDEVTIINYRSVAPIIPSSFHRNLCDYAIALSTPELHDKHMIMFENSINEIKNEDAERDLVHEVKKEVYNSANLYR